MNQFFPLPFFFGFLETDHYIQELVSEAHQGDGKVDDHGFPHNFRSVLRVGKFGGEVKLERLIVVDEVVSKLDVLLSCPVNNIFFEQRIKSRVQLFVDVFKETGTASFDGVFEILDESVGAFVHVE